MDAVRITLDRASIRIGESDVLRGFSGTFRPGTVTALIGGDGAGKSVLLKSLAGRLRVRGGTTAGLPVDRRNIGYQPADSGVWRNLSVAENLEFVARTYGLSSAHARRRSDEMLDRAGLRDAKGRLAGRLSGGMRQKLGVVLATLHQPGLVLLDEPTTGVDPISRAELWALIASAAAEGATVVFATTYLDEAERAAQLFLLGEGTLHASGTPEEIMAQTPGRIWQTPIRREGKRNVLTSSRAWRRADTVYYWTPTIDSGPAPGFEPADEDLENSSIALLLASGADADMKALADERADSDSEHKSDSESEPLVEAASVARRFGSFTALHDVSVHVSSGEVVGLLGGNGAGKTTLMRILLGLEIASEGSAKLFGKEPSLAARSRIGYVAQGLGLYPSLSASENLEFAAAVHKTTVSDSARSFAEAFGSVPFATLPLGTKRILAYLAAVGHDPELLILDEPTSGMDALTRARLWGALRSLADRGTGILVTTHYMQEAAQCDRLVMLAAGRVSAAGTASEITDSERSLTVESEHWQEAFKMLRAAGLPVLLHGRTLRVPGSSREAVREALHGLDGESTLSSVRATLEETMMLGSGRPATDHNATL